MLPDCAVPAWRHPTSRAYLQGRGLSRDETEQYELVYADAGPWRGRVLIPMYDGETLVAFQGRSIREDHPARYLTEGSRPLYCPWDQDVLAPSVLCIVEGFFDVVVVNRVVPAVATLGILPSSSQLETLKKLVLQLKVPFVLIWYDAGAEPEAFGLQLRIQPFVRTLVVEGVSKDPGALTTEEARTILSPFLCGQYPQCP